MADELDDSFFAEEPSDIDDTDSIFDDEIDELDEIVIEREDAGGSNRPFLLSLLGLLGVGVGAFLCLGLFNAFGIGGGGDIGRAAYSEVAIASIPDNKLIGDVEGSASPIDGNASAAPTEETHKQVIACGYISTAVNGEGTGAAITDN